MCGAGHPAENDTPSVIDANAVITPEIIPQPFQAIAGRGKEVLETASGVQHIELSECHGVDISGEPARRFGLLPMIKVFRCPVPKRRDHTEAPRTDYTGFTDTV